MEDMAKDELTVVLDESIEHLDKNCTRVIIAGVEMNQDYLNEARHITDMLKASFSSTGKFHFVELPPNTRGLILQKMVRMSIRAKIFCFYYVERDDEACERESMKNVIERYIHDYYRKKVHYMVEQNSIYGSFIKDDILFDGSTDSISILPDAICYTYKRVIGAAAADDDSRFYIEYARDVIRTEVLIGSREKDTYKSRENKL